LSLPGVHAGCDSKALLSVPGGWEYLPSQLFLGTLPPRHQAGSYIFRPLFVFPGKYSSLVAVARTAAVARGQV